MIFHSYVSLPEGSPFQNHEHPTETLEYIGSPHEMGSHLETHYVSIHGPDVHSAGCVQPWHVHADSHLLAFLAGIQIISVWTTPSCLNPSFLMGASSLLQKGFMFPMLFFWFKSDTAPIGRALLSAHAERTRRRQAAVHWDSSYLG